MRNILGVEINCHDFSNPHPWEFSASMQMHFQPFSLSAPLSSCLDALNPPPTPDNKVYGANMGPTWGRQDPGGSHVGNMSLVIWAHPCWLYFRKHKICLQFYFISALRWYD